MIGIKSARFRQDVNLPHLFIYLFTFWWHRKCLLKFFKEFCFGLNLLWLCIHVYVVLLFFNFVKFGVGAISKGKRFIFWALLLYNLSGGKKKIFSCMSFFFFFGHFFYHGRGKRDVDCKETIIGWKCKNVGETLFIFTLACHVSILIYIFESSSTKGLFEICLFCWNWKLFIESTINKGKS